MNRDTVANVKKAGFEIRQVNNIHLDVVKTIIATSPEKNTPPLAFGWKSKI